MGREMACIDEPSQSDYLSWEFELGNMENPNQLSVDHSWSKGHVLARKAREAMMNHEQAKDASEWGEKSKADKQRETEILRKSEKWEEWENLVKSTR